VWRFADRIASHRDRTRTRAMSLAMTMRARSAPVVGVDAHRRRGANADV
jgi:hypothetical protein